MLPTIAEVLALPAVAEGNPAVVTGRLALDRPVRWVHVAPPSGGRRLLLGGELLLATGVGWPTDPVKLCAYVEELAAAGVAGLVLELGNRYEAAPAELLVVCEELGLPLVLLRREVRFVSITQAVHSMILDRQTAALRERDRVHGVFAELNRRGCSTEFLLEQAARMLERPVVLEDLNHRAVAWHTLEQEPAGLLSDWGSGSRRAAQRAEARPAPYERTTHWAEGWLRTPVEAQGQRWGTLVALECTDVPVAGEVVLESAALAVSLRRLAGRGPDEWATMVQRHLLGSLASGAYVDLDDLQTTFEASGFRTSERQLVAVARRGEHGTVENHLEVVRGRAERMNVDVVCGPLVDEPRTTSLLLLSLSHARGDRDELLVSLLEGSQSEAVVPSVVAVGSAASSFRGLLESLKEAVSLLASAPSRLPAKMVLYSARSAALEVLMSSMRSDPNVQSFVERVLGPLLAYDAKHGGDLVEVTRACVQYPSNRKRAAAACHLSRSVFYQRMKLIEELLDTDLDDGRTVAALHVALVAFGQRPAQL